MRKGRNLGVLIFLLVAVAVFLLPRFISDFRAQQLAYVGIYFIALIGLNLLTGITGQISLGHGAFMLIGGYTTAILISNQDPPLELLGHAFTNDMRDIWTIPLAGLVAGFVGFLFGFPALRLTGLYLALATFAIAVAAPAVVKKFEDFTGGGGGINLFDVEGRTGRSTTDPITFETTEGVDILGLHISTFNEWLYYLCWTIALVLFGVSWLLLRGRFGRTLRAVRDSELAAASSGVNLARYKTLAFGISAFYAGVAGSLLAIATTFVNPDTFPIALSIFLLVGVVVGGLGSIWPLVFGAVFIHFMQIEWAQRVEAVIPDFLPFLGSIDTDAPGAPAVAFGVVLILIMLAFPGGAAGVTRSMSRGKLTRETTPVAAPAVYSTWLRRAGAALLDVAAIAVAGFVIVVLFGRLGDAWDIVGALGVLVLAVAYPTIAHSMFNGQTFGKSALGIAVRSEEALTMISPARALLRSVAGLGLSILVLPGIANVVWPLFDPRRQALHDKAAKSVVVVL